MIDLSYDELKYLSMLIDYDCSNNRPLCQTRTIGLGIDGAKNLQKCIQCEKTKVSQ